MQNDHNKAIANISPGLMFNLDLSSKIKHYHLIILAKQR